MSEKKYIIIRISAFETAILFEGVLSHDDFLRGFSRDRIVSAGFFQVIAKDKELSVSTYGESVSLGLKSREEDKRLVEKVLIEEW